MPQTLELSAGHVLRYHASSSSPELAERKVTGDGAWCGGLPKHWIDSGPAALAHSRAFSASRRTTTGERPWLVAMPKQAERRMASPATWKGEEKTSMRSRSASDHGVGGAAAGQRNQELVHAGPAQQIVAAQQRAGAAGHLAEQFVAGVHAEPRVPVAEVVDIEEHHAQRAIHALHAVGLAKQHGEQGFAVVDAGKAVESERCAWRPREGFRARAPCAGCAAPGRSGAASRRTSAERRIRSSMAPSARRSIHSCGHSVGNQDNGEARAVGFGRARRRATGRSACRADSRRAAPGWEDGARSWRPARPRRRGQLRRARRRPGAWFNGGEKAGSGEARRKLGAVERHPEKSPYWMHRQRLEKI